MRAEAEVPSIRGSYINPSKAWISRTYGPEVFEEGVRGIPADQQSLFRSELVSISWYPLRYWTTILDGVRVQVQKNTGEDGPTFDRRHIYESISGTMRTVYRIAFGLFSPTTIIAKVTPYFKRVYSHGEYEVIQNELGKCLLRFQDAPVEMLPELERSFPLAAQWMLDIVAGQTVTRHALVPRISGDMFSCDLTLEYEPKKSTKVAARAP